VSSTSATKSLQAILPGDVSKGSDGPPSLAEIDASCRVPVLSFFLSGLAWLLLGTAFALVASIKLHQPSFLAGQEWLTFGTVRTVHLNTVVFGFASQTAIGVSIWLMCRLCRVPLVAPGVVAVANLFYNLGLLIGVVGIFAGDSTGIEWLEMPRYATPILFASYSLIAVWTIITFRLRTERRLYVSQWYLLAAVIWFPWAYGTAQVMLLIEPVRGVVQSTVQWWFTHNLLGLWFTPVGLAAIYYFIPKVTGRPIYNYALSVVGFWSLALFSNWNGLHHLVGGPLPAWMITVSVATSVMMLIPVLAAAINHHGTMIGNLGHLRQSPTLRFVVFGAVAYTLASLQGILSSLRSFSEVAHFTHHTVAHAHLGLYAFFSMVMFGAIYYILPRVTQQQWPSNGLISIHFWGAALGILLYVVPLGLAGLQQGRLLNNASVPFLDVVRFTLPWLQLRTVAGLLLGLGQLAFVVNVGWLLLRMLEPLRKPVIQILSGGEITSTGK
jgi:cytochrome c oxidase cbb3-type subunit 1